VRRVVLDGLCFAGAEIETVEDGVGEIADCSGG